MSIIWELLFFILLNQLAFHMLLLNKVILLYLIGFLIIFMECEYSPYDIVLVLICKSMAQVFIIKCFLSIIICQVRVMLGFMDSIWR